MQGFEEIWRWRNINFNCSNAEIYQRNRQILQWCYNKRDGVSNHRRPVCLLNRLFRPKKILKLWVTGLCVGNPPVTGGFPSQTASNAEIVSIWWRHHDLLASMKHIYPHRHVVWFARREDNNILIHHYQYYGCWCPGSSHKHGICSHYIDLVCRKWPEISTKQDVIKWKHFYWPFVRGIHRSPVNSPHKGQWRGALMFSLICVWINDWVISRAAGDLRCLRAHCDVIVMDQHDSLVTHHYLVKYFSDSRISHNWFRWRLEALIAEMKLIMTYSVIWQM